MLRALAVVLTIVALPLVALADTAHVAPPAPAARPAAPAHGSSQKPGQKPNPRPSGSYPYGYQQPAVYVNGTSYMSPGPTPKPQHHTNTVKTSTPQQVFSSYSTGN